MFCNHRPSKTNSLLVNPLSQQPLHGVSFGDDVDIEDGGADDSTTNTVDLTDVQINDPSPERTKASDNSASNAWRIVVQLIDRMLFIVLLLVYVMMMYEWLPEGYLTGRRALGEMKLIKYWRVFCVFNLLLFNRLSMLPTRFCLFDYKCNPNRIHML